MKYFIAFVVLIYLNIIGLLFVSLPICEAIITNNFPIDGSYEFRNLLDYTLLSFIFFSVFSICLFLIFCVFSMIFVYKIIRNNQTEYLKRYVKKLKLSAIPYFLINFILHLSVYYGVYMIGYLDNVLMLLPVSILIPYIVLMITTSFSIGYIILLRRKNIIDEGTGKKYLIFQLFFVIDIIGVNKLIKHHNKMSNVA